MVAIRMKKKSPKKSDIFYITFAIIQLFIGLLVVIYGIYEIFKYNYYMKEKSIIELIAEEFKEIKPFIKSATEAIIEPFKETIDSLKSIGKEVLGKSK